MGSLSASSTWRPSGTTRSARSGGPQRQTLGDASGPDFGGTPQGQTLGGRLRARLCISLLVDFPAERWWTGGMARRLRIEYEGAIYQVMARGDGRQPIVHDENRQRLRED